MKRPRATWWLIFSAAALVVIAALVWVTAAVMELERRELSARADARQQESLRLALWRMDSWLSPRLAREAARPYFEYLPYYPQQRAYTTLLNEIQPGEVLTPSPLLTLQSEYFPIHFQLNADGTLTSPQVPTGNLRDLAEATALSGVQIDASQARLDALSHVIEHDALATRLNAVEQQLAVMSCEAGEMESASALASESDQLGQQFDQPSPQIAPGAGINSQAGERQQQQELSKREYQQRAASSNMAQQADAPQVFMPPEMKSAAKEIAAGVTFDDEAGAREPEQPQIAVGPLVAMWIGGNTDGSNGDPSNNRPVSSSPIAVVDNANVTGGSSDTASTLMFVRRVTAGGNVCVQGFLVDWPQLRGAMLGQIGDLFADAALTPVKENAIAGDPSARILATVPAELVTPPDVAPKMAMFSPARMTLALTWLAVLGAIAAAGVTLHHSIAYAAKRSRFTSAVTHELRTPLTTFRMYSEMLAENMVRDEAQRKTYLQTLKSESARLATLVENVLAYARLEEGRSPKHAQTMTVGELLDRVRPMLERRAAEVGLTLQVQDGLPQMSQMTQIVEQKSGHSVPGVNPSVSSVNSVVDLSRSITIDADAIGQILFNLVDNACKYASGPEVTQRTIDLDAAVENGRLRITVRDHGPGIPVDCARTIFKPFDRGRHGPGDTTPGVGLGLALARGLARDLRGDLTLERPTSGPGAAFVISIPV